MHSPRQAGRSDLCSQHQHGRADQSACFVISVTHRRRISQVCYKMARCAGLVALAATNVRSNISLLITTSVQWVCGHTAWLLLCQIARKWSKRLLLSPNPERCCVDVRC